MNNTLKLIISIISLQLLICSSYCDEMNNDMFIEINKNQESKRSEEINWDSISTQSIDNLLTVGIKYKLFRIKKNIHSEQIISWISIISGGNFEKDNIITLDKKNDIYLAGNIDSSNLSISDKNNISYNGRDDVFIAKTNKNGELKWIKNIGGSQLDKILGVTSDILDNIIITGYTFSPDFPVKEPYQSDFRNGDAFISKFDSCGDIIWSTYLGGKSWIDGCSDITVYKNGDIVVVGWTGSSNFPILKAFDTEKEGDIDAFVAKFSSDGKLIWSTYLGGSDGETANAVDVDNNGNIVVTGWTHSRNFPTKKAYSQKYRGSGKSDIFVTKMDRDGKLLWSTFLSGKGGDEGIDIKTDSEGSIIVVGKTYSNDFPTVNGEYTKYSGNIDAFVTKFSSRGRLLWSTYLGGNDLDECLAVHVDQNNDIWVTGLTCSNYEINNTANEIFPTRGYNSKLYMGTYYDIFVSNFSASGMLKWSSLIGGNGADIGNDIIVDKMEEVYITGITSSPEFPSSNGIDLKSIDNASFPFIIKLKNTNTE